MEANILDRIRVLLQTTDLTVTRLASLVATYNFRGASETILNRALKGGQPLSENAVDGLSKVCSKLERLIALVAPLKLSFQDVQGTKTLLQKLDRGSAYITVIDDIEVRP
jgi:hypothetical protein